MTSLKSKVFNFLLRNRHLFNGKLRKEKYDLNTSIPKFRELCEKGADRYAKIPKSVTIKSQIIESMKTEWLIPDGADGDKVIMYVHGGGYVSGSCNDHRGFVSKFAKNTGVTCLTYEYRLAPEHPFPAAVDDSLLIYKWLLTSGFAPENILLAGESAGGGLSLALLLAIKESKIAFPVAAVVISPWTDLTCSGDSYKTKNKGSLAPLDSWFVFSAHYSGNHKPELPLISPLFGNIIGFPPLYINAGTEDELYDDSERFFNKAKEAGIEVIFKKGDGMVHCYPLLSPFFPEAVEAMNEICTFIQTKLQISKP